MGSLKQNLANNILSGGKFDATDLSGTVPASNVNNDSLTNLTTFSPSLGDTIQSVASDPSPATEGDFWYNTTIGALKGLVQIKAWSSGGNMNTARSGGGGSGSQTAALSFGGTDIPGARTAATEEYSGYTWVTSPNSMNTARANLGAAGTQTATLAFGGVLGAPGFASQSATESWNGTSWTTSPATLNTARYSLAGFGTQTAAVAAGGTTGTETELYDGTAWTSNPTGLNTSRRAMGSAGTQTAGLVFGGGDGPAASAKTATESWNGSTWTSVNSIGTARYSLAGFGTQTSAVAALGNLVPGAVTAATEEYDGTSWVTTISASTARGAIPGSAGTTSKAGLVFGGYTTVRTTTTEEYNSNINAITQAVWSSGGNLSTARAQHASANAGTQTAGLAFGGYNWVPAGNIISTEEYNGSSWTGGGNLPAAQRNLGGAGTQTAGLAFGGLTGNPTTSTFEYDGSTWSPGGSLNTGGYLIGNGGGVQTAAIRAGSGTSWSTTTELYDGTTWTSANPMAVARAGAVVDGTQTAAISAAGEAPPAAPGVIGGVTDLTELYDGTSWTAGSNTLLYLASQGKSGGPAAQTALMIAGGDGPAVSPATGATQEYDGTAFTNTANLSTSRRQLTGGGTKTQGLVFGGSVASTVALTNTEEYTGSTLTETASTITTS
jgi:hypothetical protein